MNHHILLDKLTATIGAWLTGSNKFFATSVGSVSFGEHLHQTRLSIPEFETGDRVELEADTLVGRLDPAFWVYRWQGDAFPINLMSIGMGSHRFSPGRNSPSPVRPGFPWDSQRDQALRYRQYQPSKSHKSSNFSCK